MNLDPLPSTFVRHHEGQIFIAEPARRGRKLVWSVMSRWVAVPDELVDARKVPKALREAARAHFAPR